MAIDLFNVKTLAILFSMFLSLVKGGVVFYIWIGVHLPHSIPPEITFFFSPHPPGLSGKYTHFTHHSKIQPNI
jgi:hypothetical protein